jgi:hypothetical protein
VHSNGVYVGAIQKGFVGARIISPDAIDQFVLAKKPAALRLRFGLFARKGRQTCGDGGGRRLLSLSIGAFQAQ